jgi:hypothetical protein
VVYRLQNAHHLSRTIERNGQRPLLGVTRQATSFVREATSCRTIAQGPQMKCTWNVRCRLERTNGRPGQSGHLSGRRAVEKTKSAKFRNQSVTQQPSDESHQHSTQWFSRHIRSYQIDLPLSDDDQVPRDSQNTPNHTTTILLTSTIVEHISASPSGKCIPGSLLFQAIFHSSSAIAF